MNDMHCVDSAISELLQLQVDSRLTSSMKDGINHLLSRLRLLELYVHCLIKWNEALQGKRNRHLGSVRNPQIKDTLRGATKGLYSTGINALETQDFRNWDSLASKMLEKIQLCNPKIRTDCLELLDCSFQCRFSSYELQKFFRYLYDSLDDLVRLKVEVAVDAKMQIQGIKEKLHLFTQIFEVSRKVQSNNKDLKDFITRTQAWAYNAACVSLLYWLMDDHQEGEILPRVRIFLSTPEVTRMFLAVLKHLWSLSHNRLLMDEGVPKFVDFLLEILQLVPVKDGIQSLQNELMFLTTYLVDPPTAKEYREDVEFITDEVQSLICSLNASQLKGGTAEKRDTLLQTFLEKTNAVKAKVRELYARIFLDSSSFDFPRINVVRFIDSLLENLEEISILFPNHQALILEDMPSLRSFLEDILELQNKHTDVKDLETRIVNVVYRAQIAFNMLFYTNNSLWYDTKCLADIRDEIKLISREVTKIQDQKVVPQILSRSIPEIPSDFQEEMPRMDEIFLGFQDEIFVGFQDHLEFIINQLIRGGEKLHIVSIVGSSGQGKTTLAKNVYNRASVQYHFHVQAWCCASDTYKSKKLLLNILSQLIAVDIEQMTEDDLAEMVYKCLRGKRYLIVLDDIWDIRAWENMKFSFPDDNNGSRIIFTSRVHDVALKAKDDCSTLHVRQLSHGECWELLEQKVFYEGHCPTELEEVGKRIARNCNGLPLAVVLIARILWRNINLDWWEETADTIDSLISNEGGMDIVELSYKQLPEHLKPCFLYFAAFQQDKVIRVRRLIQLWISEGFVCKSGTTSLEDAAKEYLRDLASRSLVAVLDKSSTGGIKTCRIHSLFYDFCLEKAKEEKFMHVESGNDLFFNSVGAVYKNYRICMQSGGDGFFASNPSGPCVHSLLFFPDYTCLNKGDLFSICNFKVLQVLDLEDMEFNGYFPEEVILLVLLRYLAVWCPNGILSIPPSIAKLRKLETFRVKRFVRFGDEICLPHTMWTMKRLRHVDVGGFSTSFSDDCETDEESLALDNIQSFSAPSLCYGEDAEKLLRRVPKVRKLRCRFNDSCEKQNPFPALDFLSKLESLNVMYVGNLFYPCAFYLPCTLKKLTLAMFKLPWIEMSEIGKLPNLEVLKLLEDAFDGEIWDVEEGEFPKLKFLKLRGLNIAMWNAFADAFPCLEQLLVENCNELEEIPWDLGGLLTLKKIQVRWCKSTVARSARFIQGEQLDLGNDEFEALITDIF